MVQAILDGRKTVTRRIIKQKIGNSFDCTEHNFEYDGDKGFICGKCGYGVSFPHSKYPTGTSFIRPVYKVEDILYVRETFCPNYFDNSFKNRNAYKADYNKAKIGDVVPEPKWHPSTHMPREAARIFLKVTDVRVERVQDITEDGARAEGIKEDFPPFMIDNFHDLWNSTIKKKDLNKYGWGLNPWVWVIEFEREEKYVTEKRSDLL